MLERMFVGEEKLKLEHDRGLVQQGEGKSNHISVISFMF